jgi:hypothetical protein
MNMPKTDFKVGDLIFVSDDFINNDFHSNLKSSPALIVGIDKLIITTLIGDKLYKWSQWDLEHVIKYKMKPGDLVKTIKDVHMRNLRNTHVEIISAGTISLLVKKNVADGRVHVLIGDNMYETYEDNVWFYSVSTAQIT